MEAHRTRVEEALQACRSVFVGVGVVSLVINLLMLTGPLFMLQIYDRVLTSRSVPTLVALAGITIGLYAFFGLLEGVRSRVLSRVGTKVDEQLSGATFDSSVTLPLVSGRRAARVEPVRDLELLRQFLAGPGPSAMFDMPWMPVYLLVVFLFHPALGFIALAGVVVMCALIALNDIMVRKPTNEAAARSARRNALVEGARANAESVAAMGLLSGLRARWLKESETFLQLQGKAADRAATFGSLSKTFRLLLQSAILGTGAYLAIHEAITPGILIAASIITARAVAPIEQAVAHWRGFVMARHGYGQLREVLSKLSPHVPETQLPLPSQTLKVEGAFVSAPGVTDPIVRNISFELKAGQALGVIGPSSAGKSTLGRALVGVWPTVRGKIRLDGAEFDQWEADRLSTAIGYLPQDIQLFAGTVAENIARFRPDWNSEDVVKAAQLADAHDLITGLPDGYDTQIGEGGAILSGGQRQRVALARALYGDPFLIVLDEPNSNLDAEGEAALTQALRRLREQERIVVVIAHRPSAIAAVDMLMVLRGGQMEAYGPRDQVLKEAVSHSGTEKAGLKVVQEG